VSETPFHDHATKIAEKTDFVGMQYGSDNARSHSWWRNLVEYGAWQGPGETRVGPPTPEALAGIAKLFGTSREQVAAMIAADWYGVHQNTDVSARVRRLAPTLDDLTDADADLIESIARRLAQHGHASAGSAAA